MQRAAPHRAAAATAERGVARAAQHERTKKAAAALDPAGPAPGAGDGWVEARPVSFGRQGKVLLRWRREILES